MPGQNGPSVEYASSENSNTEWRPKLVITYTPGNDYISINSPNGGEEFYTGEDIDISWTIDQLGDVTISLTDGNSDLTIDDVSASDETYSWTIPDDINEGSNYKISISNGSITGVSNTFTIIPFDSCHILIEQNKISIKSSDSEQGGDEAINVIDGDINSIWHTQYSPDNSPYPHEIVFELDKIYGVSGLKYTPRQDGENGRISEYEIYVSEDSADWALLLNPESGKTMQMINM